MEEPIVSLIFPVYNGVEMLHEALLSLRKIDSGVSYEVILVDDGSPEDMSLVYDNKKLYDKLIMLPHSGNSTISVNAGVKVARGKYIQYQNSDVLFKQDNWLKYIVDAFKRNRVKTVGCKTFYPNNKINHSIKFLDHGSTPFVKHYERGADITQSSKGINICDAVSGCGMTTTKELWEKLGGFNVYKPFGWDDIDWCLRTWESNARVACQSDAWFYHFGSKFYGGKETPEYHENEKTIKEKYNQVIKRLCKKKKRN